MEITPDLIQSIYNDVEKHAGDVETLRTILISLLVATLTGLTDEQVETHVMRIVVLSDANRNPGINPRIKDEEQEKK